MAGLLKKDFYVLNATSRFYLVLWLFPLLSALGVIPGEYGIVMSVVCVVCAPLVMVGLFQGEENWRWGDMILCAPVKRSQVVLAKYLMNFCVIAGCGLFVVLCGLALGEGQILTLLPVVLGVAFFLSAVYFPMLFRYHSAAARAVACGLGGLAGGVAGGLGVVTEGAVTEGGFTIPGAVFWSVFGVGFLLMLLSYPLSVHLYEKRK